MENPACYVVGRMSANFNKGTVVIAKLATGRMGVLDHSDSTVNPTFHCRRHARPNGNKVFHVTRRKRESGRGKLKKKSERCPKKAVTLEELMRAKSVRIIKKVKNSTRLKAAQDRTPSERECGRLP